jgi:glycosyltransferase involved in cell wall biosynthesis
MSARPLHVAVDCRLMLYRKAGISNYARRLVQALAALRAPDLALTLLLDRRDRDSAWLPDTARVWRTVTPAHHAAEPQALPIELVLRGLRTPIDVLHSPDFITCRGAFAKVITVHDLYFYQHPEVLSADGARYYGRVEWSAQQADRVIAVSQFTRADIARLLPAAAGKTSVVHEAADSPANRPGLPLPEYARGRYVLFAGTFEPRKNIATLLRALALTPPDVRLIVAGEAGWIDSAPAALAQSLGLQSRVHLAGRVSDAELDALYRGARLLAHPALSEGFGLTVLEAMQRGTPVVCSDSGALPEVAGDAALFHAPTDAAQAAAHIEALWRDDALHAGYAARARARAAQFSWDAAARETLMVYRRAHRS